jgi:hypothetical protein
MALTLDPTVAGTSSNAYLTRAACQLVMEETPNASAWTSATTTAQDQAIVYATRLLDTLTYKGAKSSTTQALQWPRSYVVDPDYSTVGGNSGPFGIMLDTWPGYLSITSIPTRMQRATAMLALEILRAGTSDVWGVDASLDVARKSVDVLSTEYVAVHQRRLGLRRYPSVWREVFPLTLASEPRSVERA